MHRALCNDRIPKLRVRLRRLSICNSFNIGSPALHNHIRLYTSANGTLDNDFWKFNGGRWLWNEKEQLSSRYVKFDVEALKSIVCKALGAERCTEFAYYTEDIDYRYFYMVLDGRIGLLAHIPLHTAVPISSSIASNAATLTFLRDVLRCTNVPKVVAWSASTMDNPVGREFLIVEDIKGKSLQTLWMWMPLNQASALILRTLLQTELIPGSVPFCENGSLYFKEDVSPELQSRPLFSVSKPSVNMDPPIASLLHKNYLPLVQKNLLEACEKYRIGPLADNDLWRRGRSGLAMDRGPWLTMYHYLNALAQNQIHWLKSCAQDDDRARRPPFHSRDYHIDVLRTFQEVVHYIVPPEKHQVPSLWNAFRLDEVIVPDESSYTLAGINGWKGASILPYCMQAIYPPAIMYTRGNVKPSEPILVPDLEVISKALGRELTADDEAEYRREHTLAMRFRFVQRLLRTDKRRMNIVSSKHFWDMYTLPVEISRSWENSIVPLRRSLYTFHDEWKSFTRYPCPISLVKLVQHREQHEKEYEQYGKFTAAKERCLAELNAKLDGVVEGKDYDYDRALQKLETMKRGWDEGDMGGPFPIQDGQLSYMLAMCP